MLVAPSAPGGAGTQRWILWNVSYPREAAFTRGIVKRNQIHMLSDRYCSKKQDLLVPPSEEGAKVSLAESYVG
jgi:hypothetical protein